MEGPPIDGKDVLLRVIRRVYETDRQCLATDGSVDEERSAQLAAAVTADVVADNEAENQTGVHVFNVLMVTVLHDCSFAAAVSPVEGTDIDAGYAAPSLFYKRSRQIGQRNVEYSQLLLFIFKELLEVPDCPNLVDYFFQIFEACFNCIGRHKEAFEHLARGYIQLRQEQHLAKLNLTVSPPQNTLHLIFTVWLDSYKIDCLNAAIINPLLFLFKNYYAVYENIASHGTSFWSTVIEAALQITMPHERLGELDMGWTWGATSLEMNVPLHQEVVRRSTAQVGASWRTTCHGLVAPTHTSQLPRQLKGLRDYEDLGELAEAIKADTIPDAMRAQLSPMLGRFLALLSPLSVVRRFAEHLVLKLGTYPDSLQKEINPIQFLDATDPDNIIIDDEGVFTMLESAGVHIKRATVEW